MMRVPVLEFSTCSTTWEVLQLPITPDKEDLNVPRAHEARLNIVTWNIWSEGCSRPHNRWSALFAILFRDVQDVDIIAMQEVRQSSWELLLQTEEVQKDWIAIDLTGVIGHSNSWHGNTMLVRKRWLQINGYESLKAIILPCPTNQGRSILVLEVGDRQGIVIRIANFQLESRSEHKTHRRKQLEAAVRALLLPRTLSLLYTTGPELERLSLSHHASCTKIHARPHAVLLGDTSTSDSSEVEFLFQEPCPFIDAYAAIRKIGKLGDEVDEFGDATLGVTYPQKGESQKRVDYVLFRPSDLHSGDARASHHRTSMRPVSARLLGSSPIPGKTCHAGRDGKLYPSAHLGVFIRFQGMAVFAHDRRLIKDL